MAARLPGVRLTMRPAVWAVVPPDVMTPDGQYGPDWKVWCWRHEVSVYRFLRESERRRARFERARAA